MIGEYPKITLPPELADCTIVASVSGGKDSTAMMLALREAGVPFRAVFADTGWEAPETYAYLNLLRERLCPIDVVAVEGGMPAEIRRQGIFAHGKTRWCTRLLKLKPLHAYQTEHGADVFAMGIRADESLARSGLTELEPDRPRGRLVWSWRPLIRWAVEDVLRIHLAHGVPVNPLYRAGFSRVGCFPCIYARKEEIRLWAERAPDRVELIRGLEAEIGQRYPGASYFRDAQIDGMIEWSHTSRGGRQLMLIDDEPSGGCMAWGLCDTGDAGVTPQILRGTESTEETSR